MRFRVLGPLQVRTAEGDLIGLGAAKHRTLLSILLLHANEPVRADRLLDGLWPDRQPRSARAVLRTYVTGVRSALSLDRTAAPLSLTSEAGGYRLCVPREELDVLVFRDLAGQGDRALADGDLAAAAERLHGALALWRGRVAEDVVLDGAVLPIIADLDERRLAVHEAWFEARLALGQHAGLIGQLRGLVAECPLRERLSALLMRALSRAGRQAEALAVFAETRRLLVEELGIEPGPELQRVHVDILNNRDAGPGDGDDADRPVRGADRMVPRELPPAVRHFAGRADELVTLTRLAGAEGAGPEATVPIAVIDGMAGVGKTTLAVHWAHQLADRFPDGQLYVNLHGFDAPGSVLSPADAVRGFLDALAVPTDRIPVSLHAQAALYRSLLASRRMLVVLDNARDAVQVRPLLPGSPGCMAVVTSRHRLAGLLAEGAHPLTLASLTTEESRELLARHIDPDRVAGQLPAADEIISLCARLPLALAVVAARAAAHPGFPLAALAAELRAARGGLDAFNAGDPLTDVGAAFSASYRGLADPAARAFRLLALCPGPAFDVPAAASLVGDPVERAHARLRELAAAHLVEECAPGRFAFHDLLRRYASQLVHETDPEGERRAAVHRVLDHYLHAAHAAYRLLDPQRDPLALAPTRPGVTVDHPPDVGRALAWFTAEHAGLLAAVRIAAGTGCDNHAWQLACTVTTFLELRGHWHDWVTVGLAAVDAARRLGDRRGQARAHRSLVGAYTRLDRCADAHAHLRSALDLFRDLGDDLGQGQTHLTLSLLFERERRYRDALDHAVRALRLLQHAGNPAARARARNAVGWNHALLGDHERAIGHCELALAELRRLGDPGGQAHTWDSLGYAHHHLGDHQRAAACYRHALDLFREVGDRYHEAVILAHAGANHHAAGDLGAAREAWQRSLAILVDLRHPDADQVRADLRRPPARPTAA
jgi:DNA-binding SARP family transcriptional activator